MTSGKSFDFTINNYDDSDIKTLESWTTQVNGLFVSKEVAAKIGTPHLQGRIIFKRMYRFKQLKKLFPKAHFEKTKCGRDALYIMKQGSDLIINVDNRKGQGHCSDLDEVVEKLQEGTSIKQLWSENTSTMIRYHKGIEIAAKKLKPNYASFNHDIKSFPDDWPLRADICTIYWGNTGIGKTEFALAQFKKPLMVRHMDDLVNLDPTEHDGVVFDDMDFMHLPRTAQIHLVDARESSVHVRYTTATMPPNFPRIFTTNNYGGRVFADDEAINRRIKIVELFDFIKN